MWREIPQPTANRVPLTLIIMAPWRFFSQYGHCAALNQTQGPSKRRSSPIGRSQPFHGVLPAGNPPLAAS